MSQEEGGEACDLRNSDQREEVISAGVRSRM